MSMTSMAMRKYLFSLGFDTSDDVLYMFSHVFLLLAAGWAG